MKEIRLQIPGYATYYIDMGDRISISIKPTDKDKPLITLNQNGVWENKQTRSFYKIDESGARWKHTARRGANLNTYALDGKIFIPDNHLATIADMAEKKKERKAEKRIATKKKVKSEKRRVRRQAKRQTVVVTSV